MLGSFFTIPQQQYSFAIGGKCTINSSRQLEFGDGLVSAGIRLKQRQFAIDSHSKYVVPHPQQMSDFRNAFDPKGGFRRRRVQANQLGSASIFSAIASIDATIDFDWCDVLAGEALLIAEENGKRIGIR
jgi:hypothetical protein